MAKKVVRFYTVRDEIVLENAERFDNQYELDEPEFIKWNSAVFPVDFKIQFREKINKAKEFTNNSENIGRIIKNTPFTGRTLDECNKYFTEMVPVIESTFPNKISIWNQFGFNEYRESCKSYSKMVLFMENLFDVSERYKTLLTLNGFSQMKIDKIKALKEELQKEQIVQLSGLNTKPADTQKRIIMMNMVWLEMQKINRASKIIFQENVIISDKYELPNHSSGTEAPISGIISPRKVKNILDMDFTDDIAFKIKNTGTVSLKFGITAFPTEEVKCIKVGANNQVLVSANILGNIQYHYLNVSNQNDVPGSFSVLIVTD